MLTDEQQKKRINDYECESVDVVVKMEDGDWFEEVFLNNISLIDN